jgi:phosphoserine phosphatase RsbU/P
MFKKKLLKKECAAVEEQVINLTRLININGLINSTLDMGRLLTLIMETITDIMQTEVSTLLLYEEQSNDLIFKVALGEAGMGLVEKFRIRLGQGIAGWVAETRKPLYLNDVYADRRFDPEFDRMTGFKTRAIICSPLLFKGKLIGVIQSINPMNRSDFTDEDMKLFQIFSDQAALAVQNAAFFQNALEEERIKSELSSAKVIHDSLIPDAEMEFDNITIFAKSVTAREIGGNFHGLFRLDRTHVGIALGSLHEKGVPGGIYASILTGALKALTIIKGGNPAAMVRMLNLVIENEETRVRNSSLLYGVLDLPENKLRFVNVGVAYPIMVRDNVSRYLRFGKRNIGQDISDSMAVSVSLKPGDLFVLLSDGIINVRNSAGMQLGLKKIMAYLENDFSAEDDIIGLLFEFAKDFSGPVGIREDISIIVLRIK